MKPNQFSEYFAIRGRNASRQMQRFEKLLEPASDSEIARRAVESAKLTRRYFGRAMRLFAPIYLSNECINSCAYCGFSKENAILRMTLEIDELAAEVEYLMAQGFRNILLVSGEHPKFVSNGYLEKCVRRLIELVPSVSLEVCPMETEDYVRMVHAGAEGLLVYQESYDRNTYHQMHPSGPKRNFEWRLNCPERAYAAGFRRLGVGVLFGLHDWRQEAIALATHIEYLLVKCWKAQIAVSLPRLRPAAGEFAPITAVGDRELIQVLLALRLTFPQIGITMSTRESPAFRDALAPVGITMMSAGSHTEPGGYTGQGREKLHKTVGGRTVATPGEKAECQFVVYDDRSPRKIAEKLRDLGLETVWKDWEVLCEHETAPVEKIFSAIPS
jgi:2-iminoacetate synthase